LDFFLSAYAYFLSNANYQNLMTNSSIFVCAYIVIFTIWVAWAKREEKRHEEAKSQADLNKVQNDNDENSPGD